MTFDPQPYITRLLGLVGNDDPMQILSSTPARLSSAIARANRATRAVKPAPSRWSIDEIAAHLADAELVGGYRLRMIAATNATPIQAFDQDQWAKAFNYASCDAGESARLFAACRAGTLRMLARLSPEVFDHHGVHEERGIETMHHLLRLYAGHDRNHLAQIEAILATAGDVSYSPVPQKPDIPLDLVDKIDLRVGTIVDVAEVANAERLMRLTVDFGETAPRSVIAGIRQERANPQALIGRQALFYCNVPRRTIRGHESQAMLCDVGYADGVIPALLEPEWPVPNGVRAG